MNVTNEAEQTARNIAITRSVDVGHAPGIAPRESDEDKGKIEEEGMGRGPGCNLAEDRRGGGLEEMEEQGLFKETGGDLWITLKPERCEGVQGEGGGEETVRWMRVQETHPPWKWCNQTRKTWKSLVKSRRKQ